MYARQMYDKCQLSILLITSVRPFPVPRQKVLFQRDLRFDRDVNNQTLREDRLISVQMFNMFCLVWRYFRSSQKVFQTLIFFIILFFPFFCPEDFSEMAGQIFLKFSGMIENDNISRRFFHFFKIHLLSSVSYLSTKSQ